MCLEKCWEGELFYHDRGNVFTFSLRGNIIFTKDCVKRKKSIKYVVCFFKLPFRMLGKIIALQHLIFKISFAAYDTAGYDMCSYHYIISSIMQSIKPSIMLVVFLILSVFVFNLQADPDCAYGCLCFENILECSEMRFTYFPAFPDMIRYNTKKLWVRNIPRLDMSTMDIDEWPNLLEINLKGKLKSTLHILYFFLFTQSLAKIMFPLREKVNTFPLS